MLASSGNDDDIGVLRPTGTLGRSALSWALTTEGLACNTQRAEHMNSKNVNRQT